MQQNENTIDISKLTFIELWEEYREYIKFKLKDTSYKKEINVYLNHIVPYFKNFLVIDITAKVYIKWMNNIESKRYSYSYKSNLHTYMVSILNYAVKFYDLKSNVASRIGNFNKGKEKPKEKKIWTLDEYIKFISVIDDDLYKLFFNILFFTGLRIGECIALTWNDFKNGYLDINKTISKEKDENNNYIISSPKTPSSIRRIQLDNQSIIFLEKLYENQSKLDDFSNNWYIFGGNKPFTQTTVGRRKNKYCELAKVKKIRLHDFRHSHATLLLSNGTPITTISHRLGHSDIALTLNTYSHFLIQDEEKAINTINNMKSNNNIA